MEPDEFFEKLQQLQKSGDLSQDIFQDMLRNYLSNVGGQQQNELVNQLQRQNELKEQRRRLRQEEKQRVSNTIWETLIHCQFRLSVQRETISPDNSTMIHSINKVHRNSHEFILHQRDSRPIDITDCIYIHRPILF